MSRLIKGLAAGAVGTSLLNAVTYVDNVLVFPGLFRGLLDAGKCFDDDAALRAARALAALIEEPSPERILPDVLDDRVAPAIAEAVGAS